MKFKQRPKRMEELSYVWAGVGWGSGDGRVSVGGNTCEGLLEDRVWCVERARRRPGWLKTESSEGGK